MTGGPVTNPYAPPAAAVADVVTVVDEIVPAGRGIRLGAAMMDAVIAGACTYLPFFAGVIPFAAGGQRYSVAGLATGGLLGFIGFCVWAFFTFKYVAANGQSIAKRILGIKVVRSDGTPATLSRIFWMRNVVANIPGIIPILGTVYGFVDALLIFRDNRRCLHDQIADTIVILA